VDVTPVPIWPVNDGVVDVALLVTPGVGVGSGAVSPVLILPAVAEVVSARINATVAQKFRKFFMFSPVNVWLMLWIEGSDEAHRYLQSQICQYSLRVVGNSAPACYRRLY